MGRGHILASKVTTDRCKALKFFMHCLRLSLLCLACSWQGVRGAQAAGVRSWSETIGAQRRTGTSCWRAAAQAAPNLGMAAASMTSWLRRSRYDGSVRLHQSSMLVRQTSLCQVHMMQSPILAAMGACSGQLVMSFLGQCLSGALSAVLVLQRAPLASVSSEIPGLMVHRRSSCSRRWRHAS